MRLSSLLARIPVADIQDQRLADPDADVYTVSFLTPQSHDLRQDVVYFGDTTILASVDLPQAPSLVLYGSDTPAGQGLPPDANVLELSPATNPFDCYNLLQACFLEDQEQVAIVRRMLAAHFSNEGLPYLVEEAAVALGNPIVVVDNTYRYIAYHLADLEGKDTDLARIISNEVHNGILMDDAIAYIHDEGIDRQIARSSEPLVRHNAMLDANTMTAAVMVAGVCIAHVMMIESGRPFDPIVAGCFERLAEFVGQEMQKSELMGPTAGELGAFFLANLLNDRSPSEAVTLRRIKALNFHPKPYLQVICLHAPGEGLTQLQAEQIAGQLQPLMHHALYTKFHRQLVVLVSRDDEEGIGPYGEQILCEVASLNGLACGISNSFQNIVETRAGYDQARRAVRYGERASHALNAHGIYRYRDYAYMHALDLADRKTNLLSLCHPALLRLRDYDLAHGSELMETLFCYLQVAGSTTRAAAMLTLHKNTLLYRLNRIREILGLDLSSGEEVFQLQVSYRIMLYLGLFAPRFIVERDDLRA